MNFKPIIPYAIPVLTAILGAAGGYTGHSAVSSPVVPRQEYKLVCPPIDFSKIGGQTSLYSCLGTTGEDTAEWPVYPPAAPKIAVRTGMAYGMIGLRFKESSRESTYLWLLNRFISFDSP